MVIVMIIAFFKDRFVFNRDYVWFFLAFSIPLIFTTIYLSISRNTLPHWSGISYLTLLPLVAIYISEKKKIIPKLLVGFSALTLLLIVATFSINNGWFLPKPTSEDKENLSRKDAIMDMYGWQQASEKLSKVFEEKQLKHLPIISNKWFPASHIDYYIARPNSMNVVGVGSLTDIHKYYWINKTLPALQKDALYITDSRNFQAPEKLYNTEYKTITQIERIPIQRGNTIVKYVFLYQLSKN